MKKTEEIKFEKVVEYDRRGLLPFNSTGIQDCLVTWVILIAVTLFFPIFYILIQRNVYWRKIKEKER